MIEKIRIMPSKIGMGTISNKILLTQSHSQNQQTFIMIIKYCEIKNKLC